MCRAVPVGGLHRSIESGALSNLWGTKTAGGVLARIVPRSSKARSAMREYDAGGQPLGGYVLGDPPYRAATTEHHDRRVHALALAVQAAIDAWLVAHPLAAKPRQRWSRVQPDEVGG